MAQTVAIIVAKASQHTSFRSPLIRELVARGFKVLALAPDFDDSSVRHIAALGAEPVSFSLNRVGMNPFRDIADFMRLLVSLRQINPDMVLSCFIKPVIFGTLASAIARVPRRLALIEGLGFVFTDNGGSPDFKLRLLRALVSALYRLALKFAHTTIFLNRDDLMDFSRLGIVESSKSVVLGGIGVDLNEWPFTAPVTDQIRFIFIGRLLREKGIEYFVSAARFVKRDYPEAEFVVLGDVDVNPGAITLEQMRSWENAGAILWPGHVEVAPWLERSSVVVLPSFREGVPRSVQEAMAMGRPIITTDVPGCRDTVDHGVNGFLVPVRDAKALSDAMVCFIKQPWLIESMGRESRRLAEERFDVHKVNLKFLELLGVNSK